jgi:CheY-like chemotaxis protein
LDFFDLSNDEEPILLFLDINMPVMDGWGLLDIIHEEGFNKKKLVMVTFCRSGDKDKASYSKIIHFVEKPFMNLGTKSRFYGVQFVNYKLLL